MVQTAATAAAAAAAAGTGTVVEAAAGSGAGEATGDGSDGDADMPAADAYVTHLIGKLEDQDDDARIDEFERQVAMLKKRRRKEGL